MGYYIDLASISLDDYKNKLETTDIIPSRIILKEKTSERFDYFKSIGIKSVEVLLLTLRKKERFVALSKVSGFSEEYLTILLRELNSIHPKPNKLKDFSDISIETILKLEKAGIKDTVNLFRHVRTKEDRMNLATKLNVREDELLELTKLTDLSRIKWVGNLFARLLYEAGYDRVEKVAAASHEELHHNITDLNKERNLYKGQIGLKDMKICIMAAQEVPLEIEY